MSRPDDIVYHGGFDSCCYGHEEDGFEGSVRDASTVSRAGAQRRYADELGVAFADVLCRTTYGRFYTRQEVWDDQGKDRWVCDKIDELELICRHDPSRGTGLAAWWYEYADGNEVPESVIEPPEVVPDDWQPSDDDYVWQICKKTDSGATKIYVCELR